MTEPTWKKYLTDYNEGLGLVYERFVLNDFLLKLKGRYGFANVIEAPLYGMAGVSGINSVALARVKTPVTLRRRQRRAPRRRRAHLGRAGPARSVRPGRRLVAACPSPTTRSSSPGTGRRSGISKNPAALLSELVRVSNKLVFVAVPNPVQVGYQVRKHIVEPEFVKEIDERWTNIGLIRETLERARRHASWSRACSTRRPWPDTVMPASQLLGKLGIRSKKLEGKFTGEGWRWSTMDYYLGNDHSLYPRVMKYARLETVAAAVADQAGLVAPPLGAGEEECASRVSAAVSGSAVGAIRREIPRRRPVVRHANR